MSNRKIGFSLPTSHIIALVISIVLMFFSRFIPVPGLPATGAGVLGILVGAIILWLTVGVNWTSLLILMALMTLGELGGFKWVTQNSFGNDTAVLMLLCFMLAACLTKSGFARRIAIMMMTNKFSRKSPWNTVLMYLAACLILGWFLPSSGSILVTLPILDAMMSEGGVTKEEHPAVGVMMALGAVVAGQLGNGSTPISHAVTIQGIGLYANYVPGGELDFFTLMGVLMPIAVICLIACWLVFRFIWRPDVSCLSEVDFDALRATVAPMDSREKWSAIVYGITILVWMLPGLSKVLFPALNPIFSKLNNLYAPIVALLILQLVTLDDGKPVLSYKDALGNVGWNTVVFIGCIMCVGAAVSNSASGIKDWLTLIMEPVFAHIPAAVFTFIIIAVGVILTNFISNAVAVAIMLAIALPLATGVYAGSINLVLIGLLTINAVQHAWATPPATPSSAVAAGYGWLDTGNMFRWGMVIAIINILLIYGVGSLMGAILL